MVLIVVQQASLGPAKQHLVTHALSSLEFRLVKLEPTGFIFLGPQQFAEAVKQSGAFPARWALLQLRTQHGLVGPFQASPLLGQALKQRAQTSGLFGWRQFFQ